jgi:CHAD domain-containing protein
MASTHTERERKYAPADGAGPPRLSELPDVAGVEVVEHELESVYFDTHELDLASAGITLRRRTGGDDAGWHVKLPVDEETKQELHRPLGRATKTPPKPLRDATVLFLRGRSVAPVATLRTQRTVSRLLDGEGGVLAEFCDDQVTAQRHLPPETGVPVAWREWELELVDGSPDLLDAAEDLLARSGAEPAESPSKLLRALGEAAPDRPRPGPGHLDGAGATDLVLARLAEQVGVVRRLDPLVRLDRPDAVHQMRVALRRLRSALATFRPLVDREVTEPLREEARWLGAVLGDARDAEVLHDRLTAVVDAEPVELVLGPVRRRVDEELRASYDRAHERSVEAMRSERYFALVDALQRLVVEPPWTPGADGPPDRVLLPRLRKDFKRLRRRIASAEAAAAADDSRDVRLHEARKAAKRLRYAAETVVPAYGDDARRLAKAAKRMQSSLGDHQDSVVARPLIRQLGVQAHLDGDNGFSFGRLHALEQARGDDAERRFEQAWKKARRKRLRRWLG